jgi:acetylornithine deacetylase/succinyl-diaminopimelate desuccinylase-like protein
MNGLLLGGVTLFLSACQSAVAFGPPSGAQTGAADAARIQRDIEKLVSFGTRHTLSATDDPQRGIGAARAWLQTELERISREQYAGRLEVHSLVYEIGKSDRVPEPTTVVDVVAILPGSEPSRIVAVSGHYDTRCGDPLDARSDAPGANDDGSGTALVLECARQLAGLEPRASIAFVCVAGEEQGLLGSKALADDWRKQGKSVEAFLTCDIVGGAHGSNGRYEPGRVRLFSEGVPSAGPKVVGSDNDAPSRQLARYIEQVGERAVAGFDVELVFRQDRFLRGGDHKPFNDLGIAAVRFTEPNENYTQQHQDVRVDKGVQYGDLPEFVDFGFVARVTGVCAASLRALALAPAPPEKVTMAASELSPDTEIAWSPGVDVAGYRVRMRRTSAPSWTDAVDAGPSERTTLKGYSKDDWLFAVEAYDARGNASLPVYPQVAGRKR